MSTPPIPGPRAVLLRLTLPQRDRLLEFLRRASLTGKEVPAFAELNNLITTAKPEPEEVPASQPNT
jgi:hypothetical protein